MEHVLVLSDDIGATRDFETVCTRLERAGVPAVRNTVPARGFTSCSSRTPNGVRVEINVRPQGVSHG